MVFMYSNSLSSCSFMHYCWFCCLILRIFCISFFFFFSSRRRHTRSLCDWSSDVCSSDLEDRDVLGPGVGLGASVGKLIVPVEQTNGLGDADPGTTAGKTQARYIHLTDPLVRPIDDFERSEERRVGKECRCR